MFLRILVISALVFIAACTTVEFSPANSNGVHTAIVAPEEVKVFRSDRPETAYKEIGLLHLKGGGSLTSSIEAMKLKAAAKGGNAIIDLKIIPGGSIGTVIVMQ